MFIFFLRKKVCGFSATAYAHLIQIYSVLIPFFKVTSLNILSTMLSNNLLYVIFILTVIFILISTVYYSHFNSDWKRRVEIARNLPSELPCHCEGMTDGRGINHDGRVGSWANRKAMEAGLKQRLKSSEVCRTW